MKTVGEIFKPVKTIDGKASVLEAIEKMQNVCTNMFVITENGKVKGALSSGDIFDSFYAYVACHYPYKESKALMDLTLYLQKNEFIEGNVKEFRKKRVEEIMNSRPKVVQENVSIAEAIELLKTFDLRNLIVVDAKGKLLGAVERMQLVTEALGEYD